MWSESFSRCRFIAGEAGARSVIALGATSTESAAASIYGGYTAYQANGRSSIALMFLREEPEPANASVLERLR